MRKGIIRVALGVLFTIVLGTAVNAQTVYLEENFENGIRPNGWTEEAANGTVPWRYRQGGYNPADPNLLEAPNKYDWLRSPDVAHGGTYNAWFFTQGFGKEQTKLITAPLSLENSVKPTLKFWLTLYQWINQTGTTNDILRIYYKKGIKGGWNLIQTYNFIQNTWREFELTLPNDCINKDIYIAFEGYSRWGMGVCLDDISIVETGSAPKKLVETTSESITTDFVPNGTNNNPILCSRLRVTGNTGNSILSSIKVNATATSTTDITSVKIYATEDPLFTTANLIGTGTLSGTSSTITTNYTVPIGYSYLWVTYDIASTAKSGNYIDAEIPVNGLTFNSSSYPTAAINSPGKRQIKQNLFFDDFETNKAWTLTGDFEIDTPNGLGGILGNSDPSFAISGTRVLGNDLTVDGDYDANIPSSAPYTATSPSFDAMFYKNLVLNYKRWLNVDLFDTVKVQASNNGGVSWVTLWESKEYILDDSWNSHNITFPSQFDRANNIKLRYTLSYSDDAREFSGWNIDDVAVIGNFMENDLAVTEIISPIGTCGATDGSLPIILKVKNAGAKDAIAPIPVKLTYNSSAIEGTIKSNIPAGQEATVTFDNTFPTNVYGDILVVAQTFLPGDEDTLNDTLSKRIYISKTFDAPYNDGFDINNDWTSDGNEWELGAPTATGITVESYDDKVWITSINGNYTNSSTSILTSPCFNITGLEKPMIEFKTSYNLEDGKDGVVLKYSVDNGQTWIPLGNNGDKWDAHWNWDKQKMISSAGAVGFTGDSNGWIDVNHLLPASLNGATGVRFRFEFTSDEQNNIYPGFGLNSFIIKEAPDDFGVSSISYPIQLDGTSTCEGYTDKEHIKFFAKNFGIKKALKGTPVKVEFNSSYTKTGGTTPSRTEEFEEEFVLPEDLAVGASVEFTTTRTIDMNRGGKYVITANTIDSPENFYETDNDLFTKEVVVHKPEIDLGANTYLGEPDNTSKTFDITEYTDGFSFNIKWDKKIGDGEWTNDGTGGNTKIVDINDFIYPNNKISYKATLTDPSSGCEVSSISDVFKYNPDIKVDTLLSPIDTCSLKVKQQVKVRLLNNGLDIDTLRAGTKITLQLKVGLTTYQEQVLTLTKDIAPGETTIYTFPNEVDMSAIDTYNITVTGSIPYDINSGNNTLVKDVTAFGYPTFTLTPENNVVDGIEYTYDLGNSYDKYLWHDTTTDSKKTVAYPGPEDGLVSCTVTKVTDGVGCSTKSEGLITFNFQDIAIESIEDITTSCSQSSNLLPRVTIKNTGTQIIPEGTEIKFTVKVNGISTEETLSLKADLNVNEAVIMKMDNPIDITAKGDYTLEISAEMPNDAVSSNNSTKIDFKTLGIPELNLPEQVKSPDTETELDAGDGFVDYIWSTNDYSQKITVSENGEYIVTVTDNNGCRNSDTTLVQFIRNDIALELISKFNSTGTLCTGNTEYPVTIKIKNTGNDTLDTGFVIPVSYKIGTNQVDEQLTLNSRFTPGDSIEYTFITKVSFSNAGTYIVSALSSLDDADITNNFTESQTYTLKVTPQFKLPDDLYSTDESYLIIPNITLPSIESPDYSNLTYKWNTGETSSSLTVNKSNEYILTISNGECSMSDTMQVLFNRVDLSMASIDAPAANFCYTTSANTLSVTVKNTGMDDIPAGEKITLKYEVDATPSEEEIFTLTEPLKVGETFSYTFNKALPILNVGTTSITAQLIYAGDGISANDSIKRSFTVLMPPTLRDTTVYSNTPSITLDGDVNMISYEWSTGETTPSISVTKGGDYTLTVKNNDGCAASKVITVIFNADLELSSINSTSACLNENNKPLNITIKNVSGTVIPSNTQVGFTVAFTGPNQASEYYLKRDLKPDSTLTIDIPSLFIPTQTAGSLNVDITLTMVADSNETNNTKQQIIVVHPSPTFNLTPEIISDKDAETLAPTGGTFNSYEWNTGETTSSISVSNSGIYTLKVTDSNGCSVEKSTKVIFENSDLEFKSFNVEDNLCEAKDSTLQLAVEVENIGKSAILKDEKVDISYTINGKTYSETITLLDNIEINETFTFALSNGIDLSTGGADIAIEASVSYAKDKNKANDKGSKVVKIIKSPTFSLEMVTNPERTEATLTVNNNNLTYEWSNGAKGSSITIFENATYTVIGKDANGCSSTKSTSIGFLVPSTNNFIILYPAKSETKCLTGSSTPFEVNLVNESLNTTVPKGTTVNINATYTINQTDGKQSIYTFKGQTILTDDLKPQHVILYKFDKMTYQNKEVENSIVEISGKHQVEGYTTINDKKSVVKTTQFEILALPIVNFGADTLYKSLPALLKIDLPADNKFKWNTGEATNSIIVSTEGKYYVNVTGTNGCSASDTVYVKEGKEKSTPSSKVTGINLYPNPASTYFNIEVLAELINTEVTVEIYSTNGVLIRSEELKCDISSMNGDTAETTFKSNTLNITTERFTLGTYVVVARTKDNKISKLLIINR